MGSRIQTRFSSTFLALWFFLVFALVATCSIPMGRASGLRLSAEMIDGMTGVREESGNSSLRNGLNSNRKFGFGFGALLEVPIVNMVGLEVGVLYVQRKFGIGNTNLNITRTVPTVFIPVEGRVWFGQFLSLAGGAFSAFRVGARGDKINSGSTTLGSFSSADRKYVDLGLTVAGTVNVAMLDKTGIFIEARYNRGLTNSTKGEDFKERIDDLLFAAGVRFDLTK